MVFETAVDSMAQQCKSGVGGRARAPLRYRYLFLLATVCGSCFFLLSLHNGSELLFLANENRAWHEHHPLDTDINTDYTIRTEGCTIPALHPFDDHILKFVEQPNVRPCPNSSFLASNSTHIWIVTEKLHHFHIPTDANISCCYKSFYRPSSIVDIYSHNIDDRVKYDNCIYFSDYVDVLNEFVRVKCKYERKTVHDQFFLFAPAKPLTMYDDDAPVVAQNNSYNVIILGVDAISRLNFHRTMPKTLTYLKKKGSIELFGYNKIGDNTFPNLTPILLGIKETDLKYTCWPNMKSTFDNCPFIWDRFKDVGYYTALGEDIATLGTFNFGKYGFSRTPTDYYTHTFMSEAEKEIGNTKDFNCNICMGNQYFYKVLLEYIESLTVSLKSARLFGFFWEVTMSHDHLNYPRIMDDDYLHLLKNMDNSGYLDETILIVMSDHGIRWGDIRYTKQGRLEERLPLVLVLVPDSFRSTYAVAYSNLKTNSRRLTTPSDIHATLLDLIKLEAIENEKIKERSQTNYWKNKSISLFTPVPRNRTCEVAGIDDHWCTCHKSRKVSTESAEAKVSAKHLVRHLNAMLREHPQCARLKLAEVVGVTEMLAGKPDKDEVGWREYTVVARTTPGDGVFEATLRRAARGWALSGTVSRLNLYGEQSRCIHHYQLKLYCYCK